MSDRLSELARFTSTHSEKVRAVSIHGKVCEAAMGHLRVQ